MSAAPKTLIERLREGLQRIATHPCADTWAGIGLCAEIAREALTESSMAPAAAVSPAATPSPPEGVEAAAGASSASEQRSSTRAVVTLHGFELHSAMEFLGDEPDTDFSIAYFEAARDEESGEEMPAGHYIWHTEYPEDGRQLLSTDPPAGYDEPQGELPASRGIAGEPEPQSHDAPPGGSPQRSRTGTALAVTRARQIDGDAADPRANTITELCDRLDRIDRIAHDTTIKATERLKQIMEWSGGFAKVPRA